MSIDRETLAVYDAQAADYAARFDVGEPGRYLKRFMGALPPSGKVLDLGCGPGGAATHMQAAGFRVACVDASPEMVAIAQSRGLNVSCETFDDISGDALYDGVWANFSLLHAPRVDLPRHLSALARSLKPRGVFHIGMKAGTGDGRDKLGRKYTYVTMEEITGLMTDAGITVVAEYEFSEVGLAGSEDPCLIVQGRKHG